VRNCFEILQKIISVPRNVARILSSNLKYWCNLRALTAVCPYIYVYTFSFSQTGVSVDKNNYFRANSN
jgi:hypothetical protein